MVMCRHCYLYQDEQTSRGPESDEELYESDSDLDEVSEVDDADSDDLSASSDGGSDAPDESMSEGDRSDPPDGDVLGM